MSHDESNRTPCTEVIASLSAFVDREVGAHEYRMITIHITECAPCEGQERAHRMVKSLVARALRTDGAPGDLQARIRLRLFADPADS